MDRNAQRFALRGFLAPFSHKLIAGVLAAILAFVPAMPLGSQAHADLMASEFPPSDEVAVQADQAVAVSPMYRLYNVYSSEHFYTASKPERNDLITHGWLYEGIGWAAPVTSSTPVYRLYNPYAGDHHYTTSASERDWLKGDHGWVYEGIGWYSAAGLPGASAVYRQYNPFGTTGTHNYTQDLAEQRTLVSQHGWKAEGIGWFSAPGTFVDDNPPLSPANIQAILYSAGGPGLQCTRGSLSSATWNELVDLINRGTELSFIAINRKTGKCVTYCPDRPLFGASTIKAIYIAALCKYDAPGLASRRDLMYRAIARSDNYAYNLLFYQYGRSYLDRIASEAVVDVTTSYAGYATMTPSELARLWVPVSEYIASNEPNAQMFREFFEPLGGYYKEGWMARYDWAGQIDNLAGVEGDCIYAIMSRYALGDGTVWKVRQALLNAVS